MCARLMHRIVLITLLAVVYPAASFAGFIDVGVRVGFAPPPLPVYVQPPCPAPGYLWTPGYWAYSFSSGEYYWVPGTWVIAPALGLLWTPGYWRLLDAEYVWNEGYWGPHVGFYGGIDYGFGYFGSGFDGGYWRDRDFYYNRAVTNVSNVNITNIYNQSVVNSRDYGPRPSFNGRNGVNALPTNNDLLAMHESHRALTPQQLSQIAAAQTLKSSVLSVNHGHPQVAATPRPGMLPHQGTTAPRAATPAPAKTSSPSSNPLRTRDSNRSSPDRHTMQNSASVNSRAQASMRPQLRFSPSSEPHYSTAPRAQHAGSAPGAARIADSSRAATGHRPLLESPWPAHAVRQRASSSPPAERPAIAATHHTPAPQNAAQPRRGHQGAAPGYDKLH